MKIRVSGSISNFKEKLLKRTGLPEWTGNRNEKVLFVGLYHYRDYLRFMWAKERKVFWCGSDILNLGRNPIWRSLLIGFKATHYCENIIEQELLEVMGIEAELTPMIFDEPDKFQISFKPSETPEVYITAHKGREVEYGLEIIELLSHRFPDIKFHIYGVNYPSDSQLIVVGKGGKIISAKKVEYDKKQNVIYHGQITSEQFDEEIKNYQAAIRLNSFDGFAETLAKSILLGQYPISTIYYPYIDWAKNQDDLIKLLEDLKNKKEPNTEVSNIWREKLERSLEIIKS